MSTKLPSKALQRRLLTAALLSVLASPVYAGTNCVLVDDAGNPIPVDSTAPGAQALACGPAANATGDGSTAVGDQTAATGQNATAAGYRHLDAGGDCGLQPRIAQGLAPEAAYWTLEEEAGAAELARPRNATRSIPCLDGHAAVDPR